MLGAGCGFQLLFLACPETYVEEKQLVQGATFMYLTGLSGESSSQGGTCPPSMVLKTNALGHSLGSC